MIEDVSNPFYSAIARGVEEVARGRGMLAITASSDEDAERERHLVRLCCERRVDGLLIEPAGDDHEYMLPKLRAGMRVVFIDRPPGNIDADVVMLDNHGGARRAVAHLLAHGHTRIAFIGDDARIFTATERLRGYHETLAEAGIAADESLTVLGAGNADAAEAAVDALLALPDPPTAVFAANNRITVGVLRMLGRNGFNLALVGFDELELGEMLAVPVTVVAYDPADLGRRAAGATRARARRRRPAAAARRPSHDIDRARLRGGEAVTPVELPPRQHHFFRGGVATLAGEPPHLPDPAGGAA